MSTIDLPRTLVASLVEDAVTAPSMHNAQPWRFVHRADTGAVELYGDPSRAMPREDPDHRGLHLGCGAALFGLRVAAAHQGLHADVRLLPDTGDAWHLADVRLRPSQGDEDDELAVLRPALHERHTSRFPFTDEQVPLEIFDGLCAAAFLEGCRLVVPGPWHTQNVLELVRDSERLEAADDAVRAEVAAWIHTGEAPRERPAAGNGDARGDLRTEGIPAYALGPRQYDVTSPVRDFHARREPSAGAAEPFEECPQIALLSTAEDRPREWLKAGMALDRVLLQATLDGLSSSLMSQPLEWPELRSVARDPETGTGHVHMVIRLGYGPRGQATPRRPVADVLTFG
ncbi:Acg family FMN-binding oxidoreductase [Streptomyces sp. Da 82-17]|uniref:Acg family FMN-binding oxidoreductase n=1 Tax=Streptomyces sp. Da 82-17 TaxID=3377116 RepID=UPI0038D3FB5E